LRRGSGKAFITSIIFHPTMNLVACTSNRTSIHLFEIKKSADKSVGDGKTSPEGNGNTLDSHENKKSKYILLLRFLNIIDIGSSL
jgi:hypothetical protein